MKIVTYTLRTYGSEAPSVILILRTYGSEAPSVILILRTYGSEAPFVVVFLQNNYIKNIRINKDIFNNRELAFILPFIKFRRIKVF